MASQNEARPTRNGLARVGFRAQQSDETGSARGAMPQRFDLVSVLAMITTLASRQDGEPPELLHFRHLTAEGLGDFDRAPKIIGNNRAFRFADRSI